MQDMQIMKEHSQLHFNRIDLAPYTEQKTSVLYVHPF